MVDLSLALKISSNPLCYSLLFYVEIVLFKHHTTQKLENQQGCVLFDCEIKMIELQSVKRNESGECV